MDILVTSTGNIWRRIDDGVGLMLCDALPSVFERVKKPVAVAAPVQTGPRFYVEASMHTGALGIHVKLPSGELRSSYVPYLTREQTTAALSAGPIPENVWNNLVAQRAREGLR